MSNTIEKHPLSDALNELAAIQSKVHALKFGKTATPLSDQEEIDGAAGRWVWYHGQKLLSALVGDHMGSLAPRPLVLVCAEAVFLRALTRAVEDGYSSLQGGDAFDQYGGDYDEWERDLYNAVNEAESIVGASLGEEVKQRLLQQAGYVWNAREPEDEEDQAAVEP